VGKKQGIQQSIVINGARTRSQLQSLVPKDDLSFIPELSGQFDWIFGVDEVGVACLAGPVVAGCFAYPLNDLWLSKKPEAPVKVCDSKKLQEKAREIAGLWLTAQENCASAIGEAQVHEIDELNIYHASGLAMTRAFESAYRCVKEIHGEDTAFRACLLIDGNRIPHQLQKFIDKNLKARPLVKGDTKSFAIAAASILAKNHRDRFMHELSKTFPNYGWQSNVGYPTPQHKKALKSLGPTDWHRRSFNLEY